MKGEDTPLFWGGEDYGRERPRCRARSLCLWARESTSELLLPGSSVLSGFVPVCGPGQIPKTAQPDPWQAGESWVAQKGPSCSCGAPGLPSFGAPCLPPSLSFPRGMGAVTCLPCWGCLIQHAISLLSTSFLLTSCCGLALARPAFPGSSFLLSLGEGICVTARCHCWAGCPHPSPSGEPRKWLWARAHLTSLLVPWALALPPSSLPLPPRAGPSSTPGLQPHPIPAPHCAPSSSASDP